MPRRAHVSQEIATLQHHFLELAEMVDRAMVSAMWSCTRNDPAEAHRALDTHATIDSVSCAVEDHALDVLACQPLGGTDLRAASTLLLVTNELTRIGAYAGGIGALVLRSASLCRQSSPATLMQMSHKARTMLQHAIRAVIQRDAMVRMQICEDDVTVDALHNQTVQQLLGVMLQDPSVSEWATYQLWIAHNIERMADRSVTIAERAAFSATGTSVRCCAQRAALPLTERSNAIRV